MNRVNRVAGDERAHPGFGEAPVGGQSGGV